ncbi:MAG: peptidase, partial [Lachnospiraceae bacterium]|nr:peptidase [Lachnospiraceae bacterium]
MKKEIREIVEQYAAEVKEEAEGLLEVLGRIPAPSHQEDARAEFCRDWLL